MATKFPLAYTGKGPLLLSHCRYFDKNFTEMFSFFFAIVAMATEGLKCLLKAFIAILLLR